jgi:(R,R)-butanediol dehydrogenase/meso-butanediol dehydrogenase/diacetyl reductase
MADLVLVKDYQAIPLMDLSDEQGALVEPAAVALHAILEVGVGPGDTVLVVGCGSIGCLVILAAMAAGAAVVLACEPNPARAAVAAGLGATVIPDGDLAAQLEQIRELAPPRGPVSIAFDCAGKDGTMDLCIGAVKTGGRIGVVAGHMPTGRLAVRPIQHKPVSIIGSLAYTQTAWDRTLALMNAGRYPAERIVTSHIRREQIAAEGFEALLDPAGKQLKILIEVG